MELEDYDISEVDHFFLISVGTLVLLLQSGYAFLEAGAVRSKNAVNISIRYRSIKKKDKDRREGKGRRCCLGGRMDSFLCCGSYFAPDGLKNSVG